MLRAEVSNQKLTNVLYLFVTQMLSDNHIYVGVESGLTYKTSQALSHRNRVVRLKYSLYICC